MIGTERVTSPHPWIGMVFQEESTFPWRTTLGNIEFGLEMRDVPAATRRAKAMQMLDLVGLAGFERSYPSELSRQADAGWSVAPFMLDRIEKGELRVVVKGSEITALNDITSRVHFVNTGFAAKQPDAVRAFFRAHQRAVEYMMDNKAEITKIWIRKAELKFPESAALKTWDFYNKPAMALNPIRGVQTTMEDAVRLKFIQQPLSKADLDRLIDLSYLP